MPMGSYGTATASEDMAGGGYPRSSRWCVPHGIRLLDGQHTDSPDPAYRPAPGYQTDSNYTGQGNSQIELWPNIFDNVFEQAYLPRQTEIPFSSIERTQLGAFYPSWNNAFDINAPVSAQSFMLPPFFFPGPVLSGSCAASYDGVIPPLLDHSAVGGHHGGLKRETQGPPRALKHSCSAVSGPPKPTKHYMTQASILPRQLVAPQPLLVILDLNGTLIYRKSRKYPPSFTKRPGLDMFLKTLLEKYKVMIWSSSQPHTVKAVCEKLFPGEMRRELVGEWGRDTLGLSQSQYSVKTQVYKKLGAVWSSSTIQSTYLGAVPISNRKRKKKKNQQQQQRPLPPRGQRWDQSNTVLIDDSKLKAASEPFNIVEIAEFTNDPNTDQSHVFSDILERLDVLSRHDDVSKVLRQLSMNSAPFPALRNTNIENSIQLQTRQIPLPERPLTLTKKQLADVRREMRLARKQLPESNIGAKMSEKAKKTKKKTGAKEKAIAAVSAAIDVVSTGVGVSASTDAGIDADAAASVIVNADAGTGVYVSPTFTLRSSQSQVSASSHPSPAASLQSENFLLDRLEESLNY